MNDADNSASWLAAVITPWAISPHPNFTEQNMSPQSQLALVVERRYEPGEGGASEGAERFEFEWFVDLAESSLRLDSQQASTDRLWEVASNAGFALGMRYAAAMFGTLGSAELDRSAESCEHLHQLFEAIVAGRPPASFNSSERLTLAAILQQRLTRLKEVASFEEARAEVEKVIAWLPDETAEDYEVFEVSQGISWGSGQVQRDIRHTLFGQALADKAHLEFPDGSTWIEVVRGRSGWIELRRALADVSRESFFVRDIFEERFDSMSGRITFRRSSADERAYASLILSELAGASTRITSNREMLGRIRLINADGSVFQAREALRLLRQANSKQALQSALKRIRQEGPTEALKADAQAVVKRGSRTGAVSSSDLMVLDYASDYLDRQDLRRAIEIALRYPLSETLSIGALSPAIDTAWKTVARLLPGSGADSTVAKRAFEAIDSAPDWEPLIATLSRLAEQISWGDVDADTLNRWKMWCSQSDLPMLRDAVLRSMGEELDYGSPASLTDVAILVDGVAESRPIAHVDIAGDIIVDAVREDLKRAAIGGYSIGGVDTGDVAVAFALRFDRRGVWEAVVEMLLDDRLDAAKKDSALERLARNGEDVPNWVRERLREDWSRVTSTSRARSLAGGYHLPQYPQALRAGGAMAIVSPNEFLMHVMELGAAGESGRTEAARTMPFGRNLVDLAWIQSLLLQHSFDASGDVRAEAAGALALTLDGTSELSSTVLDRLNELRKVDGVRIPLRIITGLRSIEPNRYVREAFGEWLSDLRGAGLPRVLARAASVVLAEWGPSATIEASAEPPS